jgi:hypothetical protein
MCRHLFFVAARAASAMRCEATWRSSAFFWIALPLVRNDRGQRLSQKHFESGHQIHDFGCRFAGKVVSPRRSVTQLAVLIASPAFHPPVRQKRATMITAKIEVQRVMNALNDPTRTATIVSAGTPDSAVFQGTGCVVMRNDRRSPAQKRKTGKHLVTSPIEGLAIDEAAGCEYLCRIPNLISAGSKFSFHILAPALVLTVRE